MARDSWFVARRGRPKGGPPDSLKKHCLYATVLFMNCRGAHVARPHSLCEYPLSHPGGMLFLDPYSSVRRRQLVITGAPRGAPTMWATNHQPLATDLRDSHNGPPFGTAPTATSQMSLMPGCRLDSSFCIEEDIFFCGAIDFIFQGQD